MPVAATSTIHATKRRAALPAPAGRFARNASHRLPLVVAVAVVAASVTSWSLPLLLGARAEQLVLGGARRGGEQSLHAVFDAGDGLGFGGAHRARLDARGRIAGSVLDGRGLARRDRIDHVTQRID